MDKNHDSDNSHYEVLGIDRSATSDQIKKAWRALQVEVHPDRHPDNPEMATRFRAGKDAYDCLSDADQRAAHDALLDQWAEAAARAQAAETTPVQALATLHANPVTHSPRPGLSKPQREPDSALPWILGGFAVVGAALLAGAAADRYAPRDASGRHRDRHNGQFRSGYFA